MSWIKTIAYDESIGPLRSAYRRIVGPDGQVDNIMALHSLRPHTMDGHMRLYKNVLHHSGNTLPKWWLETIGTYVSLLNRCNYCVEHHYHGLKRLLGDDLRARAIRKELERLAGSDAAPDTAPDAAANTAPDTAPNTTPDATVNAAANTTSDNAPDRTTSGTTFSAAEIETLRYVYTLTRAPHEMTEEQIRALRSNGITDGEILEINQVSAYFAYANRTVLGLGCTLDGDILGLSPGDSAEPDNWAHG